MPYTTVLATLLQQCDIKHSKYILCIFLWLDATTDPELVQDAAENFNGLKARLDLPSEMAVPADELKDFTLAGILIEHFPLCFVCSRILLFANAGSLNSVTAEVEAKPTPLKSIHENQRG